MHFDRGWGNKRQRDRLATLLSGMLHPSQISFKCVAVGSLASLVDPRMDSILAVVVMTYKSPSPIPEKLKNDLIRKAGRYPGGKYIALEIEEEGSETRLCPSIVISYMTLQNQLNGFLDRKIWSLTKEKEKLTVASFTDLLGMWRAMFDMEPWRGRMNVTVNPASSSVRLGSMATCCLRAVVQCWETLALLVGHEGGWHVSAFVKYVFVFAWRLHQVSRRQSLLKWCRAQRTLPSRSCPS